MESVNVSSPKRRWEWLKYFLVGFGAPLILVGVYASAQPSKEELQQQQMQKAFGLSRELMKGIVQIDEKAEKDHKMSESDWKTTLATYREGNKWAKELALQTLAFLRVNNSHKAESSDLAMDFIQKYPIDDWHSAIRLLKGVGDSRWKGYYEEGLHSKDSGTRASYEALSLVESPPASK